MEQNINIQQAVFFFFFLKEPRLKTKKNPFTLINNSANKNKAIYILGFEHGITFQIHYITECRFAFFNTWCNYCQSGKTLKKNLI